MSQSSNQVFVESEENRLGIGKLVELNEEYGTVAYFRTPAEHSPLLERVLRSSLSAQAIACAANA
jgi:hypothetical protein